MLISTPQTKANARALGASLMKRGYKLGTDGTDNHLVLWDLRKEVGLAASRGSIAFPYFPKTASCS